VITDPYPGNGSDFFGMQPSLGFSLSNPDGVMSYTIYVWNDTDSTKYTLVSVVGVGNGSYYFDNYYRASELGSTYYWQLCVNDSDSWTNETFWFRALEGGGSVVSTPGFESGVFLLCLGAVVLFIRKKKGVK